MAENPTTKETKPKFTPKSFDFIPKLKDKKVTIRLVTGGQPITGTFEAYNPYEILLQTAKGQASR
jgi:hypothetical protein